MTNGGVSALPQRQPSVRRGVALGQGTFAIVGGVWPLIGMRSFEAVFGPKTDRWLVRSMAGLLLTNGVTLVRAGVRGEGRTARTLGVGTAATLLAVDLRYAPPGRIRRTYLLDAVCEAGWLTAWLLPSLRGPGSHRERDDLPSLDEAQLTR